MIAKRKSVINHLKICLFLFLLITVDVLVLGNLQNEGSMSLIWIGFPDIQMSPDIQMLIFICLNLLILLIAWGYYRFAVKKELFSCTVALIILSPLVDFVLMETMTGNLLYLPSVAVAINLLIAYLILLLVLLFFCRVRVALVFYNTVMPILGLVQYYVCRFRGRPFMLADIANVWTAARVAGGYSYLLGFAVGIAVILAAAWLFLSFITPDKKIKRFFISRKIIVIFICVSGVNLLNNTSFTSQHNIFALDMWDIKNDYRVKGYLLDLIAQVQYFKVNAPENYSEVLARETAEKYSQEYASQSAFQLTDTQPVNLIMIMNESWADFRILSDTYTGADSIMPVIDSLQENITKGWLRVPVYGGLTPQTEYEVLTGNNVHLLEANPPVAYQFYSQKKEYGLVSTLAAQGYRTLAMHPEHSLNFNRKYVYPRMGFSQFISGEVWDEKYAERFRGFISDQSCYDYIAQIYDEKQQDEKLFTFLVTMQNHGGYTNNDYTSTVQFNYEQDYPEAEEYLSLVKESDKAFGNLIAHFEKVEEPTMVVMFGDHWPNIQDGFYHNVLLQNGSYDADEELYMTPFVIWTNYARKSEQDIMMSANYFGTYVLEQMNAELTDYNKFLSILESKIPVICGNKVMLSDGTWHTEDDLPEDAAEMLGQYEIIQYNNMMLGSNKN